MGMLIAHAADAPHAHSAVGLIALIAVSLLAVVLATALVIMSLRYRAIKSEVDAAPAVTPSSSAG